MTLPLSHCQIICVKKIHIICFYAIFTFLLTKTFICDMLTLYIDIEKTVTGNKYPML